MSSPYDPIRKPRKPDPIDVMLDQMRDTKKQDRPRDEWPPMAQLELMLLILNKP